MSAKLGLLVETEIGLGLTGFGVFFSFLGIIFFFDKGLIAMGNILFFSGVALTIGLKSSLQFFSKRSNFKGTIAFGLGFLLVIIGWPILGMILEAYGFVVLFSFSAKDTYSRLDLPAALYQNGAAQRNLRPKANFNKSP
ncbi:Vesicle transport protein GOT1A [Capsicum annuum]|nr:Vesicle transport protein GOT1A [Capsicum annuum]